MLTFLQKAYRDFFYMKQVEGIAIISVKLLKKAFTGLPLVKVLERLDETCLVVVVVFYDEKARVDECSLLVCPRCKHGQDQEASAEKESGNLRRRDLMCHKPTIRSERRYTIYLAVTSVSLLGRPNGDFFASMLSKNNIVRPHISTQEHVFSLSQFRSKQL